MSRLGIVVTALALVGAILGSWRWLGQHTNTQVHRINQ
jgi:hypothetical protein